MAIENWSQK